MSSPAPVKPSFGPFITAIISTLLAAGVLIALKAGMRLTLNTAFSVLIPGMTLSATFIAISMGWIFVAIGRSKVQPRWIRATAVFITLTMLELMWLTYIAGTSGS